MHLKDSRGKGSQAEGTAGVSPGVGARKLLSLEGSRGENDREQKRRPDV